MGPSLRERMGQWRHCWLHPDHRTLPGLLFPMLQSRELPHKSAGTFRGEAWLNLRVGRNWGHALAWYPQWQYHGRCDWQDGLGAHAGGPKCWPEGNWILFFVQFRALVRGHLGKSWWNWGFTWQHLQDVQGTRGKTQVRGNFVVGAGTSRWDDSQVWGGGHSKLFFSVAQLFLLGYNKNNSCVNLELWTCQEFSHALTPWFYIASWGDRRRDCFHPYFTKIRKGRLRE